MDDGVTQMSNSKLEGDWKDRAYQASLHFCVLERDVNSPMTDASLAKLFFRHIPKAVEMDTSGKEAQPGEAQRLAKEMERDMVVGRDYDEWLAGYDHLKPETRAIFAKGSQNSLNPVLDRLAEVGGYQRSDILTREAAAEKVSNVVSIGERKMNDQQRLAAMHALGMDRGG
tara:strand:- start:5628 stop:6140 length:513 start_codon:yes stop_codon:yes gene_type:complete